MIGIVQGICKSKTAGDRSVWTEMDRAYDANCPPNIQVKNFLYYKGCVEEKGKWDKGRVGHI